MNGCPTCGGYGDKHDPVAHDQFREGLDYIRDHYADGPALPDDTHWYDRGGVIPPALTRKVLHPDECVLNIDRATGRVTCRRSDHPTATSDCATTKETA